MAKKGGRRNDHGDIIIRKEEVVEGGHHGGAWKVAYADFVTAMMAFFLLMWLLNATTEEQRGGLADYFTPLNALSRNSSGSGAPFGGHTPYDQGSMVSDRGAQTVIEGKAPVVPDDNADAKLTTPASTTDADDNRSPRGERRNATGNATRAVDQDGEHAPGGGVAPVQASSPSKAEFLANAGAGTLPRAQAQQSAAAAAAAAAQEQATFRAAAQQIRDAIAADPSLAQLARQLAIDITPDGLRIQLLDEDGKPMFASGSIEPNQRAKLLLDKIAPVLERLTEPVSITGHTDAAPFKGGGRSNWDLSTERANATRRLLAEAGVPDGRFAEVSGRADREPLLPADPLAAANRRIAIVVRSSLKPPDKS
ncbi:MAG: OmpA family protein [Alphaproteobacteria bacterium]|nr:OmpA family protein [Alphaproteobacteria bacterium]